MNKDKNREMRARRALEKLGCSLHKSRARESIDNFGGYMIIDDDIHHIITGMRFDCTIEDVEEFIRNSEGA